MMFLSEEYWQIKMSLFVVSLTTCIRKVTKLEPNVVLVCVFKLP